MKNVFKKYYKQYIVDDIVSTMESPDFYNYRTSREARRHAVQNPHLIQSEIDPNLELQNPPDGDGDDPDPDIDLEEISYII